MVTLRYKGPATRADFSQVVGKPKGTEKYVFTRGSVGTFSNADAEKILGEPKRNGPDHRFETLESDSPDMPVTAPLLLEQGADDGEVRSE